MKSKIELNYINNKKNPGSYGFYAKKHGGEPQVAYLCFITNPLTLCGQFNVAEQFKQLHEAIKT